ACLQKSVEIRLFVFLVHNQLVLKVLEKVVAEIVSQVANVSIIKKVAEKVEVVKMEETVIIAVALVMMDAVVNLNHLKSLKSNFSLSFFSLFLNNYLNNVSKSIVS